MNHNANYNTGVYGYATEDDNYCRGHTAADQQQCHNMFDHGPNGQLVANGAYNMARPVTQIQYSAVSAPTVASRGITVFGTKNLDMLLKTLLGGIMQGLLR
ncbi:hypothetical protein Vretimale_10253 [Volvox reticuliferus]|uniref:Uncharacterized protein n=1 Tax=Volvox reticuliferus TaxID=1737510 RepID=A0A8J4BVD4_9CHLO|nr:hypothetical protein Vretifemale_541 [Volvox reticuliferus]GIM05885.1 hypothetical protein Vretimale_10253 [Volvox reticuliferus]